MAEHQKLDQPKPIVTAGNKTVFATATRKICRHITNQSGQPIPVRIFVMLVPGKGRHLFSARAMQSAVNTILETGNPHLLFGSKTSLLLNQNEEDAGMCSFDVSLRAMDGLTQGKSKKTPSTSSVTLAAQASADTWHRRLGHMNPRNMKTIRKVNGNVVEYTATVSGCDICAVGKSTQKVHPKDQHKTDEPTKLVYTDLVGHITPAARGGYKYVRKFTDDFSRLKEVFLLESKTEAVDSLHLYIVTVAVPLGLRIQRLTCDKGGEYISKDFKALCIISGISMEYTATATPQQNGISKRDGLSLIHI